MSAQHWPDEHPGDFEARDLGSARVLVFLLGCVGGGFLTGTALLWLGWPGAITTAVCTVCLTSVALVPLGPYSPERVDEIP